MIHNETVVFDEKHVIVWSWHNYTAVWPRTLGLTCEAYFTEPVPYSGQSDNLSKTAPSLRVNSTSSPQDLLCWCFSRVLVGLEADGDNVDCWLT